MPLARADVLTKGKSIENLYFIDDSASEVHVNGRPVVTYEEFMRIPASRRVVVLAIANSEIRQRLAEKFSFDGVIPWSIKSENSVIHDEVEILEGAIISDYVVFTSNIKIGKQFHANIYSYVAHDCVIGDFVTFAPGVKCNGNVHIQDHAYIGTGAVIKQGRPDKPLIIGRGAVVGMGAVVTKDVPAGATVVGNPARPLLKD